jgi:hypothetical protein
MFARPLTISIIVTPWLNLDRQMRGHRNGHRISSCIRPSQMLDLAENDGQRTAVRSGQCRFDKQSRCGWLGSFCSQTSVQRLFRSSSFCLHRPMVHLSILKEEPTYRYLPKLDCCNVHCFDRSLKTRGNSNSVFVLRQPSGFRVTHKASNSTIEASEIVCVAALCSKPCGPEANRLL